MLTQLRTDLAEVSRDQQDSGALPRGVPADALAGALVAIVPGFILQLTMLGPAAVDGVPDAVWALWP
jgi:hypothetical protein